jgi:surfeit locus 1 family protein
MSRRAELLFLLVVGLSLVVLIALGAWQWQRRGEKARFLADIAAAVSAEPKTLNEAALWQRVRMVGRFVPGPTLVVRTSRPAPKPGERDRHGRVPVSGFGVFQMVPFETELCTAGRCETLRVLVNRGFISTPADGRVPRLTLPEGRITLTGFLRPSEKAGLFPPYNDPAKGTYFFRTVEQMLPALGMVAAPIRPGGLSTDAIFIDLEATGPQEAPPLGMDGLELVRVIPNNHLQYAITWWSLAATEIAVAMAFFFGRRRRKTA